MKILNKFLVSKETVVIVVSKETLVLRRGERETKFGFIKPVDEGRITTVKD